MRLGLISDTHIPLVAQELPPQIKEAFRGVDLILHAGDLYAQSVIDDLARIAPVLVAMGDDDPSAIRKDKRVKNEHVLKLEGHTLLLVHERPYQRTVLSQPAEHEVPDIVVFGHEHAALIQRYSRTLYVNPGSPTFPNYRTELGTVGILSIDQDKAQAFIQQL